MKIKIPDDMTTKKCKYCGTSENLYTCKRKDVNDIIVYNTCIKCRGINITNARKGLHYNIGQIAWNKGLTKDTDERVRKHAIGLTEHKMSEEQKENIRIKNLGKRYSQETKNKHSKSMLLQYKNGRKIKKHSKKFIYNNINFWNTWEVKVAKWLDEQEIEWEYESKNCLFSLPNGHTYIIDFYLPKLNKYIEVKGQWQKNNSIYKYTEASKVLDMCIIDKRNINNINLELKNI